MKQTVAAFDFDGTIASGDAVVPFALEAAGRVAVAQAMVALLPFVRYRDRDLLKERFSAHVFSGLSEDALRSKGERFARHLQVHKVRSTMLERIEWHKERGHRLVMVSASFNLYLEPLGRILGFDDVICTTLEFVNGRATGHLLGGNIRGNAKARALYTRLGNVPVDLWAYGNSDGDVPMLARADHAFWLTRSGEIRAWSESRRKVIDLRFQPEQTSHEQ